MYGLPLDYLDAWSQNLNLTFTILYRFVAVCFVHGTASFQKLLENYPLTLKPYPKPQAGLKTKAFLCCGPSPSSSGAGHVCQGQPDAGLLPSYPKDPEGL